MLKNYHKNNSLCNKYRIIMIIYEVNLKIEFLANFIKKILLLINIKLKLKFFY